jgi:hypothetical protein
MERFFALGHAADLVIAWLLVEAVWLVWLHRRTGRGLAPREFAPAWAAGLFLAVAIRGALTGMPWAGIAGLLLAAGAAHLFDLRQRWRS